MGSDKLKAAGATTRRAAGAGHSINAVSRWLGHADIMITLKGSAHMMPNDDEELAAGVEALYG